MSNFLSCATKDLTADQLLAMLLTKNAAGEVAIRTMLTDACATNAIDCATSGIPVGASIANAIGIASCGKPALRLGIKPADLALAFGALAYADLTAANAALSAGVIFYNTALGKLDITTA